MAMPVAAPVAAPSEELVAGALRQALSGAGAQALAPFYASRQFRPIWSAGNRMLPAAGRLLEILATTPGDGLAPEAYGAAALERLVGLADDGDSATVALADIALSQATVRWAGDLRRSPPEAGLLFVDRDLQPAPSSPADILGTLTAAPALEAGLAKLRRMNPEYDHLRVAWRGAVARSDAGAARVLRANMDRARALPADPGSAHVLVDVAGQQLEVWDGGALVERMPVVVGKPSQPTPALAGLIRFLVLRPYWHMPPDLARSRIAPDVLREGQAALDRQDLELVSDFSGSGERLEVEDIDWRAVVEGREPVYLRQRPGPQNMMGAVKFIFPNRLGVYLHDTPLKGLFGSAVRAESAGCVRVSDAPRLARRLLGRDVDLAADGSPETIVDLPRPIPVYLVYLTARAQGSVVERRADIYRRDPALLARI